MQLCGSLNILGHCPSLGLEWRLTFFQFCDRCWVFQICWQIEYSTLTTSSFRIWNRSAWFVVVVPKAHLTSHSTMSGSRWGITPLWLSGSLRPFLYSSVYSCHLLILLLLLGPYHFCPLLCPSWHEMSLGISDSLEEISSLSHSIAFLYFFALITEEGSESGHPYLIPD